MNLPNYISIFRILLTFPTIYFLLKKMFTPALIFFSIAALSDALDGYFARKNNSITDLGKFLDPFADKFLLVSTFNALALLGKMPLWVFLAIFSKEFALFVGWAIFNKVTKEFRIIPNFYGKAASALLMVLAGCTLADNYRYAPFKLFSFLNPILLYSSLLLMAISLFSYINDGIKYAKNKELR